VINLDKVILIVPSLARGGAERIVSLISKKLSNIYKIIVVTYREREGYDVCGTHVSLNTETNGILSKIINVFKRSYRIRKLIKIERPKKVISFVGNVSPILSFKRVIPSIHNNPSYYPFSERLFLNTIYKLPNVEKIITVSNGIADNLKLEYHLKNVNVICNPIDEEDIDLKIKGNRPIEGDYIIGVGRLHRQKRFDILIKAYNNSGLKGRVKLLILGEGPLRNELQKLINSFSLESDVLLIGLQTNPYIYMKYCKYLVLTSDHEGFGNVLIEALYCGVPVISVDCNYGPNEIITNNYNGLLIHENTIEAIAEAMKKLYENQNFYTDLQKNAKQSVERFQLSNIISKWIEIIEN
jgi:glycosyltransferase involved in cell wall biosynthesis